MNDAFFAWLDLEPARLIEFGFAAYALFTIWRKLAARWVNWFPLVAKFTRLTLYVAAFGVLILGFRAMPTELSLPLAVLYLALGAAISPLVNTLARRLRPKEKLRRGADVDTVAEVNKQAAAALPAADFQESMDIAGVNIPRSAEPYHFLVVGATGSGKSVAITRLIDHIEERGDIALVVDSGGDFSSRYFRAGRDHILNPFDDRCTPWSPTAEMQGPWDAEALAKSMIPDGVGDSKEWNGYAQTLVTSVLRRLAEEKRLSIKDLLYYVQVASIEELTPFLASTAAAAQLSSERTFGSIRTIASNYLATYAYLADHPDPFSVAKFIRTEKPGFLFLTYRDDQLDSLRNMISCVLDVASRTILSLPENNNRRVWLIIDEFASIGKVQSIEAVATKARKKGGCLLLGLQSVSQLQDRYGEKGAQTILSCLSSWLVLRCSDPETAEYISTYIGDSEISRMTRGESSSESGGSASLNEQIQTQRAVMPVELQRLANLEGFFKLSGNYPVCRTKLAFPKKRAKVAVPYAERDFDAKPMLRLEAKPATTTTTTAGGATLMETTLEAFAPATPAPAEAPAAKADLRPASAPLKIVRNPVEDGPEAFEEMLTELADAAENEF